jgi:anaerobic selenocysteine-containing dehydrogenase
MGLLSYGSMDRRFFHALGASLLDRTICASAGAAGLKATIGKSMGFDPEAIVHARFIVAWGANIVSSNVHLWPHIEAARRRGAKLVAVDPYRSRTAEMADQHLALLPGTDGALALGVMHVVFRDGLEDRDYIERYTIGADALRERVADWTPQRAAEATGLTAAEVEGFAREYATRQPSALRVNYGLNRHAGAGMAVRTIACLPALVGAWRHPGGGLLLSTSGTFPWTPRPWSGPDLVKPGTRTLNMSRIGALLLDPAWPRPSRLSSSTTPTRWRWPRTRRSVRAGFAREDLFTVVHDLFLTDTADFADIVLPATTTLEHYDIHKSYGHLYLSLSRPPSRRRERASQHRGLPAPGRAAGPRPSRLRETDEQMARQALRWDHPHLTGIDFGGWSARARSA